MKKRLPSGADTGLTDKDGKAITVHSHLLDASGTVYLVNGHCQAVPIGTDAAASDLQDLIDRSRGEVRVMSAAEVLERSSITVSSKPSKPGRKPRRIAPDTSSEGQEPGTPDKALEAKDSPQEGIPDEKAEAVELSDKPADFALILSAIPDRYLAYELRRRGYVFTAVKPIILKL